MGDRLVPKASASAIGPSDDDHSARHDCEFDTVRPYRDGNQPFAAHDFQLQRFACLFAAQPTMQVIDRFDDPAFNGDDQIVHLQAGTLGRAAWQ